MQTEQVTHDFEPIFNKESRILMLGTMPSPKSREVGFYYGHPRNRFWKVLSAGDRNGDYLSAIYKPGKLFGFV